MTTNSITEKFKSILDNSLVLSGDDLKSRFYLMRLSKYQLQEANRRIQENLWKEEICLSLPCLVSRSTSLNDQLYFL